ncbi:hypothetical protein [Streptomyces sp. NPDC046371]|uniref:hypothetical protein n=1 Tax=Streptomyces sp. NPDC046371 TaxID=3154916 RepID=UPI00340AD0C6
MSQEAAPEHPVLQASPLSPGRQAAPPVPTVPEQPGGGAPKGLLQQMEELMEALTADLSRLDADIQSSADRQAHSAALPDATG